MSAPLVPLLPAVARALPKETRVDWGGELVRADALRIARDLALDDVGALLRHAVELEEKQHQEATR